MIYIGCDPDLHSTALAWVDADGFVLDVRLVKARGQTGPAAVEAMVRALHHLDLDCGRRVSGIAVEGQELVYTARSGRNPRDVALLGPVTGAAAAVLLDGQSQALLRIPPPAEWKKSQPKKIHQGRTCARLGWGSEIRGGKDPYRVPVFPAGTDFPGMGINDGDWKHALDAVGLALWIRDQVEGR